MSYTYLLEQGAEFSAECFSDIAPSVLSRLTVTADACCTNDSETACCLGSQCGTISELSTDDLGEASQTSSVEASHVRTSQQPDAAQASQESGQGSGVRWHELSARYDRDTHSWRTHRCLWDEDLPWSLVTLPNWGLMRDGVLYQRPTPEHLTSENESGYWPTPTTRDRKSDAPNRQGGMSLYVAVQKWPTPRALDGEKGARTLTESVKNRVKKGMANLAEAVVFATPTARDWRSGKASQATMERNSRPLSEQVGGLLNPDWVEWLMGWPIGFSALEPLVTDRFQQWRRSHGDC